MKFRAMFVTVTFWLLLIAGAAPAAAKEPAGQMVDSGSFGVFMNGKRVATETFSIQQSGGGSTTNAQVKEEGGSGASQSSELQVTSAGAVVRYARPSRWLQFPKPRCHIADPRRPRLCHHAPTHVR